MKTYVLFPLVLLLSIVTFGQDSVADKLPFEVPSKHISVLLVPDPNCPIKLSGPISVIGWSNGALSLDYELQNISDRNVESFSIQETDWNGSSGYGGSAEIKENFFFVPLMTMLRQEGREKETLATFDEKGAGKSFLYPKNKIWIGMVTKVKLSDGTTYDASKKFQELESFLDNQWELFAESKIDLDQRERNVREYVEKLMSQKN